MNDEWKGETLVDTAGVDKRGNIKKKKKPFKSRRWDDDCLIISLDICDGEHTGEHILLWPLADDRANAPGLIKLYLSREDINVELDPNHYKAYKPII
jgi:hypothetical protein